MTFPSVVDNTMRSEFIRCPESFRLRFIKNLRQSTGSEHLHGGGAYAKGLETARRAYYGFGKSADEAIWYGFIALTMAYGPKNPDNPKSKKTYQRIVELYWDYFDHFPLQSD